MNIFETINYSFVCFRLVINSEGDLRIRDLLDTDEGLYVCVAQNMAGSRGVLASSRFIRAVGDNGISPILL